MRSAERARIELDCRAKPQMQKAQHSRGISSEVLEVRREGSHLLLLCFALSLSLFVFLPREWLAQLGFDAPVDSIRRCLVLRGKL
jgi:hypothetical protein